jgi:myosin heavy subunit
MDNLIHLNSQEFSPAAILHQLSIRYKSDRIYTAIGSILVSINPFKPLPLYTAERQAEYVRSAREGDHALSGMAPHVFGVAGKAYRNLVQSTDPMSAATAAAMLAHNSSATPAGGGRDQAIVISGESGSGKTEAVKLLLSFLSDIARTPTTSSSAASSSAVVKSGATSGSLALGLSFNVDQDILQSNPLLEAFGNAKTVRNDNSSRFGKWMAVTFAYAGVPSSAAPETKCAEPRQSAGAGGGDDGRRVVITGGRIVTYLLEKSRVVAPNDGERSYHICK